MEKVRHIRSAVPGKVPDASQLAYGQIAVNYADGLLFTKLTDDTIFNLNPPLEWGFIGGTLGEQTDLVAALGEKVDKTTSVTAGSGLTGGGSLSENRSLALGTGQSVTLESTNLVTVDSHAHAFEPGGTAAQYIRGDGALEVFPTIPTKTPLTLISRSATGDIEVALETDFAGVGVVRSSNASKVDPIGDYTVALGDNAIALGAASVAIGQNSETTGDNATAVGRYAKASTGAAAHGYTSTATGTSSVAVGRFAEADMTSSVAIGPYAKASGSSAAFNSGAVALGVDALSIGMVTIAIGSGANAGRPTVESTISSSGSIAIGSYAVANGSGTIAIGASAKVENDELQGVAIGGSASSRTYGAALGYGASAGSAYGVAVGPSSSASGTNTVALGRTASAAHEGSTALGANTSTTRTNEVALGRTVSGVQTTKLLADVSSPLLDTDAANKLYVDLAITPSGDSDNALELKVDGLYTRKAMVATAVTSVALFTPPNVTGTLSVGAGNGASVVAAQAVVIGSSASAAVGAAGAIVIGRTASVSSSTVDGIAIGRSAVSSHVESIALGNSSTTSRTRELSVGTVASPRLVANVADPLLDGDAVNLGTLNARLDEEGTFLHRASNLSDIADAATSRSNLGLGNVNNTSDADKPISSATQAALNNKQNNLGYTPVNRAGDAMSGGLGFGSSVVSSPQDLSRHLALYGQQYGFSVTAGNLNYVTSSGHIFYGSTGQHAAINNTGIYFYQSGTAHTVWHAGNLDPMTRASTQNTAGKTMVSAVLPSLASATGSHQASLRIDNGSNNSASAAIAFHRGGQYAVYFGVDTDNQLKVGGWSMGGAAYRIWHEGILPNPVNAAQCNHNSGVVEFGPVGPLQPSLDCPNPYVVCGLSVTHTSVGGNLVSVVITMRARTLRNY